MRNAALALCLAASLPFAAAAATDNACWNRNVQVADFYLTPPEGGDASFFQSIAPKGVIALAYANRSTMNFFPTSIYEIRKPATPDPNPTGCKNRFLSNLQYFMGPVDAPSLQGTYSLTKSYPDPEPAYTSVVTVTDNINPNAYYQFGQWPNGPTNSGTAIATAATACSNATGSTTSAAYLDCTACFTSGAGFWLNPNASDNDTSAAQGVFLGNFLRFYPPKWVLLKLAYKRLLNSSLLSTVREGVFAFNGAVGGSVIQKLLPQSCNGAGAQNGQGILKQKLAVLDGTNNTSTANPLAEMLFNIGYYFSGASSSWAPSGYFTTNAVLPPVIDSSGGPCANNPCGQEFVVLFSDGRGDQGNPYCTDANTGTSKPCASSSVCTTVGMGNEQDGDNFLDPSIAGGAGALVTGSGVHQTGSGTCSTDYLTDVARWMSNNPMLQSFPGRSNVITYIIGIGSNTYGAMNSLQSAANAGGGKFVLATDFQSLESQIRTVLLQILKVTTSFSVAAITTVQTRGSTFAFIPRFKPLPGNNWQGTLYRFKLFNEFSAGCSPSDYNKPVGTDWLNPNGNASCNDVYLTDADSADATASPTMPGPNFFKSFVGEDSQGNFIKLDTTTAYPWSPISPAQAAKPVWEASARLTNRINGLNGVSGYTSSPDRTIYTVYDSANTGTYNTMISFDTTTSNLNILTPLLKLGGATGTFCNELSGHTRNTYAVENDCAADVIKFMHGQDVMFQSSANTPGSPPYQARPNILGDIFHSSPILVTPPVQSFLCDLGVANQCLYSLYGTKTPNGSSAYSTYTTNQSGRTQFILVGANDGMLHAFRAGTQQTGDDPETPAVESSTNKYFDLGDGYEMWAFIPPDMLPKLKLYVLGGRHEQFVDGTPMVRDIWVDGSGASSADYAKQADEFHTIAIVGEREGGRHYFALDVTTPTSPVFKWMWPLPGTADDMAMGETWNDHAPAPPPIGPIAQADDKGPLSVNGFNAKERYVVGLGGGFDPNLERGRGIFILDAWNGSVLYRYSATDTGASGDARGSLFPVAATVAMLDTNSDGLFDTAVVGDTIGQVWTLDLWNPGPMNAAGSAPTWFGGRAFVTGKAGALYNRTPFFQLAAAAKLSNGDVRVFLGGGDRFQVKDSSATSCGLDNLLGCIRRGCQVTSTVTQYQSGANYDNGTWNWTSSSATDPTNATFPTTNGSNAQSSACTDQINANISYTLNCNGTAVSYTNNLKCDWGATTAGTDCPSPASPGKPQQTQLDNNLISCSSPFLASGQPCFTPSVTGTEQKGRFYSFRLFDPSRPQTMASQADAAAYDSARLTDTNLVDVTPANTSAPANGNGWFVSFNDWTEKTSSAGLLLGGCAIWNTLTPTTTQFTCGSVPPKDNANLYQADAITGAVACGTSTQTARYVTRSTIVPPVSPTPVISVNAKTGQVTYSGVSIEPGNQPLQLTVGGGDILGTINWLEVPRDVHNCRHSTSSTPNCPQ